MEARSKVLLKETLSPFEISMQINILFNAIDVRRNTLKRVQRLKSLNFRKKGEDEGVFIPGF